MEFKDILGVDIHPNDSLLTAISFQDLIDTVNASCSVVNEAAVRTTLRSMVAENNRLAEYYLSRNMARIISAAKH